MDGREMQWIRGGGFVNCGWGGCGGCGGLRVWSRAEMPTVPRSAYVGLNVRQLGVAAWGFVAARGATIPRSVSVDSNVGCFVWWLGIWTDTNVYPTYRSSLAVALRTSSTVVTPSRTLSIPAMRRVTMPSSMARRLRPVLVIPATIWSRILSLSTMIS